MRPSLRSTLVLTGALLSGLLAPVRPAAAQRPVLDDTAILSLLARVSAVEVECTGYVMQNAALPDTKALAERLHEDHGTFRVRAAKLAEQLELNLEPGIVSEVADSHSAVLADLHHMSGINVDRTFIDHEIALLQYALHYVNRVMLPSATNGQVRAMLAQARPLLERHLALAREAKKQVRRG